MSFPELRQYSVFQVSRDAGVPMVLLAAILILVGLLPALYTSRRKVWVRAEPAGDGSVLKVGGFALQRKPQFEEEFAKLLQAMTDAAGGSVGRRSLTGAGGPDEPGPGARSEEGADPMTDLQWARISNDAFNVALFSYLAAMVGYFAYLAFRREVLWKVSRVVAFVGVGANLISIVARGFAAAPGAVGQHVRVLDALGDAGGGRLPVHRRGHVQDPHAGRIRVDVLGAHHGGRGAFLYVGPGPLVPALNSYWIKIHVQAAIWGSSLFALGGIVDDPVPGPGLA